MALSPLERFEFWSGTANLDQIVDSSEVWLLGVIRKVQEEDLVLWDSGSLGGLEGSFEDGHAGEQDLGPGRLELMFQLAGRVSDVGGGCNTRQAVNGV